MRLLLTLRRGDTQDKALAKKIAQFESKLRAAKALGALGLSVRMTADHGAIDVIGSQDMLTPPRAEAQAFITATELLDDPAP